MQNNFRIRHIFNLSFCPNKLKLNGVKPYFLLLSHELCSNHLAINNEVNFLKQFFRKIGFSDKSSESHTGKFPDTKCRKIPFLPSR